MYCREHLRAIIIASVLYASLASICSAQQVEITVDKRIRLDAAGTADAWIWTMPPQVVYTQVAGTVWIDESTPPGKYRANVLAIQVDWDARKFEQRTGFIDFSVGPAPTPPPNPDDDEDEDDTPPTPTDAPFDAPGFTVLIIREGKTVGSLPESRKAIFTSRELMRVLERECIQFDGITAYRIWDDDYTVEQMTAQPQFMVDAYFATLDVREADEPWIAISDGETGTSQPLPATIDETVALIQEFAQ